MKHLVHLGAEKQFFFLPIGRKQDTSYHYVTWLKREKQRCGFVTLPFILPYTMWCVLREISGREGVVILCKYAKYLFWLAQAPNSLDTNLEHWAFLLSYFRNFWWQKLLSEHSQQFYILLELHHLNFQLYFYIHLGITIWKIYNDNFLLSVNKNRCLNSRNLLIKLLSILYTLVEVWLHFCIGYLYCP